MNRTNALSRALLIAVAAALLVPLLPSTAEAKLAFFRNYPDVKWNVIKTEHFNVFYPQSKNPDAEHYVDADFTARKTAYVAEEMYPMICGQFNYYLDETINIVMPDQTDSLTGFTVPNFDWIVVSGRHSDLLWRLRGHHDWLRAVMYHEFAHVVSLKADNVFAEESFGAVVSARWADGRANTQAAASSFVMKGDPWWWVEGGGEYYPHVAGINVWTASRDMRMRMDVLDGMILNYDDLSDYYGSNGAFDGNRHYLEGYAFALYLEERFGQGVYQAFGTEREKKGWTPQFKTIVEDVLNIPANQLYDDWRQWMLAKYKKVQDEIMKDPAIGSPIRTYEQYWEEDSPEGREVIDEKLSFKGYDRYAYRRDRERTGVYNWGVKFAPDGSKWGKHQLGRGAVISYIDEARYPVFNKSVDWDLEADEAAAFERKALHKTLNLPLAGDGIFDFSPDSKKVVSICNEDRYKTLAGKKAPLFTESTLDMDGWDWHELCIYDLEQIEADARAKMVDFFGYDPMELDAENYQRKLRGLDPRKEWDDKAIDSTEKKKDKKHKRRHWLDWANSKDMLLQPTLPAGKEVRRVSYPAWSPDGRTIAFVQYDDGTQNIGKIDLESGEVTMLTSWDDGTRVEGLDWSPDGTMLVFDAWRFDQNDIYVIGADGLGGKAITFDRYEDREPSWGHDGNIYFVSDRVGHIQNVFKVNPRIDPAWADQDYDGIVDADDACPTEVETINLYKDTDGCPDGVPVRVTKDAVEISDKVFFELDSAVIKPESFELLDAVARVVLQNPQLQLIEVGGHTDSQGDPEYNLELSGRRSEAVLNYLTSKGVQEDRLNFKGYGLTVPVMEGETEEAFAANRRVEFKILQQVPVDEVQEMGIGGEDSAASKLSPEKRLQLDNAYITQITNVVSGAFFPTLTPGGNLAYSHFQAYGWKDWGLNQADFYNVILDASDLVHDPAVVKFDTPSEVYPDYTAVTSHVKTHASFPRNPLLVPILEIANVSLTHVGINVGAFFSVADSLDSNAGSLYLQAGEDLIVQARYENKSGWVEWFVGGLVRTLSFDYGFENDEDGSNETTDDRFLGDIKQKYFIGAGFAGLTLPFSPVFNVNLTHFSSYVGIQGVTDGKKFRPISYRANQSLDFLLVDPRLARSGGAGNINPRGGRTFSFSWSPNFTASLNTATGGIQVDDGQIFKNYFYNRFYLSYAEHIALPWKNGRTKSDLGHTLSIQADVGLIDRNVPFGDELRGGGAGANRNFRNPFASNTLMAGYEPFSLSGETTALVNLQYRFPIIREIDKKIGPIYFEALHAGFFGTVGNFWSYRIADGQETSIYFGEEIVNDPVFQQGGRGPATGGKILREWPGMEASQNGNVMLADIGFELRLAANMWNRSQWLTSFKVAYGFNETGGRGDTNNDGIFTNSSDPSIALQADEKEPAGLRFYIGIGTGW